jgi:hypothetical protein
MISPVAGLMLASCLFESRHVPSIQCRATAAA